jgi:hypothetical protein
VVGLSCSGKYIFAGSLDGCIYRSANQGETWGKIQTSSSNSTVFGISIHPNGNVFASTYLGGVIRSTDNGDNWLCVGFKDTVTCLAINADGIVFVGTQYGMFRSSNEGITWLPINAGLTNLSVRSIGIDSKGYIFIGTNEDAVFGSLQPTTFVGQSTNSILHQYFLYQNYPNPFNPKTTIKFQIPISSKVEIKIFDCLGKEIKELVNEYMNQGAYMIDFDASNISSGIYFYQLRTNDFITTKKMLLLR